MKTAAIYARVSTSDQVKGTSLDGQVASCQEFAAANGYTITKEVREDMSGGRLDRPGLGSIRDMAQRGELQAVIVWDVDRLSRVMTHQMLLVEELERARTELLFVNSPREDTPEGKMLFGMKGLFAEYERAKIQDRTRRGKEHRTREGKILGSGNIPYGYSYTPGEGRYELISDEAQWVVRMFDWLVVERCTLGTIARRLTAMGAATKRGAIYWHRSTVHSILTNSVYAGQWYWNKTESARPKKHRPDATSRREKCAQIARPKEDWIGVATPAIISPEVFEAAQHQFQINKDLAAKPVMNQYLLRSLLTCLQCGRRLVGRAPKSGTAQYYCTGHSQPGLKEDCRCPFLTRPKIEERVWNKVVERISNKEVLLAALEGRDAARKSERDREDSELIAYLAQEHNLKAEDDRWLEAYGKGAIDLEQLGERMAITKQAKENVQKSKASLQERIKRRSVATASREAIDRWCEWAELGLPLLGFEDKREMLELIEFRGVVDGITGKLRITWLLTEDALSLRDKVDDSCPQHHEVVFSFASPMLFALPTPPAFKYNGECHSPPHQPGDEP